MEEYWPTYSKKACGFSIVIVTLLQPKCYEVLIRKETVYYKLIFFFLYIFYYLFQTKRILF